MARKVRGGPTKRVNLLKEATREDVAHVFLLAYEKECKGVTLFRYGCKRGTLVRFADVD